MSNVIVVGTLLAAVVSLSLEAKAESENPCDGVFCSGHGRCVVVRDVPACACEEGYVPDERSGLNCLAIDSGQDSSISTSDGSSTSQAESSTEDGAEWECNDEIDDDGDGLVDCADPDCSIDSMCHEMDDDSHQEAETDLASTAGRRHHMVEQIVAPMVQSLWQCVLERVPGGLYANLSTVEVLFEFTREGGPPTLLDISVDDENPLRTCVLESAASIRAPGLRVPTFRSRCHLPMRRNRDVVCSSAAEGAPRAGPQSPYRQAARQGNSVERTGTGERRGTKLITSGALLLGLGFAALIAATGLIVHWATTPCEMAALDIDCPDRARTASLALFGVGGVLAMIGVIALPTGVAMNAEERRRLRRHRHGVAIAPYVLPRLSGFVLAVTGSM